MRWLDKAKSAAVGAKDKVSNIDVSDITSKAKEYGKNAYDSAADKSTQTVQSVKQAASDFDSSAVAESVKTKASDISQIGQTAASDAYEQAKEKIDNIDWDELTDMDAQKANTIRYWETGTEKINQWARSTFEVDKDTFQMVSDLQGNLPVPAKTSEDIFEQCRNVAIQRAMASFFLNNTANSIDDYSQAKYENLSENYKEFGGRIGEHNLRNSHENFAAMQDTRNAAKDSFSPLEDGYNKDSTLYAQDSDIEHVIAAKDIYGSTLLKAGTTDKQLLDAINDSGNLVFTNSSVNRSKRDVPLSEFLEKSVPHPEKPGVRVMTIQGEQYELNEEDCNAALEQAQKVLKQHKSSAALEIGMTAVKTGATMAVQQVVGMIVVETIDIFMDEIKVFSKEFKLFDEKGMIQNVKELKERLTQRLNQRFEERQIWAKAKTLGIEAGVSGALSVIPQILISMVTKLPSFTLGLIREGTLSCVRCVRIMSSNDENKLQSISIIMASTASAVVGLYVGRVIGTGLATVPLLNRFNSQITAILSGLVVTAVPLVAIYVFDQNKSKFIFASGTKTTAEA
ncbi:MULTISPECIES: hypothetical protein [Vibrio]|uniref:hypothetical protein n=1 Tax=Vibrio TaxID=662 RepID=UPI0010BD7671|nr:MULTISPECIES: hypothetical protein [Vibrio]EGR0027800.1 hypothetical protein [Vibrio alginolyticus]EJV5742608.1 hypothetical protein [Vibrio alginolyticus]MCR9451868.1 hypothetical protein [Vibrio alginolyticus]MCR9461445.1 hypothetical protein [Vibrio alginolyticus]MDW1552352.1 hypothetical protein [Vibrio sp. YT-18]